jgi:hypothetical protein
MKSFDADDRMVTLLARSQEARNDLAKYTNDYVHALKRWAAYIKATSEDSIGLTDALIAAHGLGDMTDRQIETLVSRTEVDHDSRGPWNTLVEACDNYYRAKMRLTNAQAAALGYIEYLSQQEDRLEKHSVPDLLLEAMERHMPEGLKR